MQVMIYVDPEKCDGCGLCVEACPHGALKLSEGVIEVDQASCRETSACLAACPQGALLELLEPGERRDHPVPVVESPVTELREAAVAKRTVGLTAFLGAVLQFFVSDVAPELWRQWLRKRRQPSAPTSKAAQYTARGRCRGEGKLHRRRRKGWRT
jgi:Fe-S-cluster-containing hydrogenase component 2